MFGVNVDSVSGGVGATGDADLRRAARRRLHEAHALTTAKDIEDAALVLGELEVARTRVPEFKAHIDAPRGITLIALRARATVDEPAEAPETPRWLAAVRRALLARMPLGTRLDVRAPGYLNFSLDARIEVLPRRNPAHVEEAIRQKLRDAFALTPRDNLTLREFGVPVTARDLAALIRSVPGVRRTTALAMAVDGAVATALTLRRMELARLDLAASHIVAERAPEGGAR